MERVGTIVDGYEILLSFEIEVPFSDAVAHTPNEGGEVGLLGVKYVMNVIVTHDDISVVAVSVGNHNGYHGTSIVGDGYFVTLAIAQNEEICLLAVDGGLKVFAFQATKVVCFF